VIRPAAFCGVVGFKPTYGRISTDGVIPYAESADHVGLFSQDVAGMRLAASVLCDEWDPPTTERDEKPVIGVPGDEYLDQASTTARDAFGTQLSMLQSAGYSVRRAPAFEDVKSVTEHHKRLIYAEKALTHTDWFSEYEDLYHPDTADRIRRGWEVSIEEVVSSRLNRRKTRTHVERVMQSEGIDLWIAPSAPGPAPNGIDDTGDAIMNTPWTHTGLPVVSVPAGLSDDGLPLGVQCISSYESDETLLQWATAIAETLPDPESA
jgi:Asp-tRNA(Asn)/Glu-tRNA(Gln) amidotransferase A subunit family amidase